MDWSEYADEYVPPPRVLNSTRIFLPYNGWVDIGLYPTSDGNGNAEVTSLIVINYNDGWLSLNKDQLADFFVSIREIGDYETIEGRHYFDRPSNMNWKFYITKKNDFLNIVFVDDKGDRQSINQFMEDDLIPLIKMERMIVGRIETKEVSAEAVVSTIEDTAMKCYSAEEILELAEYTHCNPIIFEMAVNHFHFFTDFVEEVKSHDVE